MSTFSRRVLGIILSSALSLVFASPLYQNGEPITDLKDYHLLVLNSYSMNYDWTAQEVRAILDTFSQEPWVILQMEFMDTKFIDTKQHFALLRALYANKYRGIHFDVIIATDNDALNFMRDAGEQLFPQTPIVFCGINDFTPAMIQGMEQVTGVNEAADFSKNLDLIARLQPAVRRIHVITDELTTGHMLRKVFEKAAAAYEDRFQFHYLLDLPMETVLHKVSELGAEDAIFYLSFFQDGTGKHFTPWEAIPEIARRATAPLYGQADYMLGKGVLGGFMKSAYYQGRMAAALAHRILRGEKAADIPIVMNSPNRYMFDYRQLERFGIPIDQLPEGSLLINEPETFYYRYKKLIWSVISLIGGLLAFILILLINIRRRKRAQRGLRDIIDSLRILWNLDAMPSMGDQLIRMVRRVIFLDQPLIRVERFHYGGDPGSWDGAQLRTPAPTQAPLPQAIVQGGALVRDRQCIAFFPYPTLPENLFALTGDRKLDEMDEDLLKILTQSISMALETLEKHRIQESLETARKIQCGMLPKNFAPLAQTFALDLYARLIPAKEVGGDLYDLFAIDADRLCLVIGDVSDKGIPAALFMAMAKTLLRGIAQQGLPPHEILGRANAALSQENEQCMFVTLFLGIFHRGTSTLTYANAGHNPPYLLRTGVPVPLPIAPSPALGVFEGASYRTQSCALPSGEGLFLYTDGISEAMDSGQQLYGTERLEEALKARAQQDAHTLIKGIIESVQAFSREAGQSDDIAVLFLRRH